LRTFQPRVERVELVKQKVGVVAELRRVHPEGLFEIELENMKRPFKYRLRCHAGGRSWDQEDPYRFGPVLGELDRFLLGEGTHLRAYERLGAHPMEQDGVKGVGFAVWAPNARRVSLVGHFNGWDGRCHLMQQYAPNGIWELFVPGLDRGEPYNYEIQSREGRLMPLKADPFAFKAEAPPRTASVVEGLGRHAWKDQTWMADRWKRHRFDAPMRIYEVHLGSWRRREDGAFMSYQELAETLVPYAKELGFTHLQLLPISEHPFYGSWGYQPLGLFAPTGRYGSPDDFRAFVDACHQAGMGVLLDWVPAHFPEDAHGLNRFDGTHLYEHADPRQGRHMDWGTLIYNFGRTEVQNTLIANALYWLDQFHLDGLRVDAVASMLYLDYSRKEGQWIPNRHGGRENLDAVAFLKRLNATVYAQFPDTVTIAEESTAWPAVSRPVDQGGLGFGFKWNMGWMHDTLRFLARTMLHRRHHQNEITFSMLYQYAENFVLPLSHDEVVYGKKSLLWKMPGTRWEQFANLRLLLAYQTAHPGKKLLFMGGEFGQDHEWDHNRALEWELLQHAPHLGVQNLMRDLNALHEAQPALWSLDHDPAGFRWVDCEDRKNSIISMLRLGPEGVPPVLVVLNLSAQPQERYGIGCPLPGPWRELINTDSERYGGQNIGNMGVVEAKADPLHGFGQRLELVIPPLGVLFLSPATKPARTQKKS